MPFFGPILEIFIVLKKDSTQRKIHIFLNQSSEVKEKYIINFTFRHTSGANQTKAWKLLYSMSKYATQLKHFSKIV